MFGVCLLLLFLVVCLWVYVGGGDGCDDDDDDDVDVGLVVYLTKMKTFSGIGFVFLLPVLLFFAMLVYLSVLLLAGQSSCGDRRRILLYITHDGRLCDWGP
jgi:hypothetical protein